MKLYIGLLALLLTPTLLGQSVEPTAKVIVLSADEAAEARSIQLQEAALEARREVFHDQLVKHYLIFRTDECYTSTGRLYAVHVRDNGTAVCDGYYKPGWENGFKFSEDYKAIVASAPPPPTAEDWYHFTTPPNCYPRIVLDAFGRWIQYEADGTWQMCGIGHACENK